LFEDEVGNKENHYLLLTRKKETSFGYTKLICGTNLIFLAIKPRQNFDKLLSGPAA